MFIYDSTDMGEVHSLIHPRQVDERDRGRAMFTTDYGKNESTLEWMAQYTEGRNELKHEDV